MVDRISTVNWLLPGAPSTGLHAATKDYVDTATGLLIPKSLVDAKGDLIAASANDTVGRLAVGTDTYGLVADSAQSLGLKWAQLAQLMTVIATAKTGNYTAANGEVVPFNTAGGALTGTLPTATPGAVIIFVKTGTDTNKLSVAKQAGDAWMNGTPPPIQLQSDIRWFLGYTGGWVSLEPTTSLVQFPVVTLTDAATIAIDCSIGRKFKVVATASRALGIPSGTPVDGQIIEVNHKANGGAFTLSLTAGTNGWAFGSSITALDATASAKTDILQGEWDATAAKWWVRGWVKGF